jgi:hypothetical protein
MRDAGLSPEQAAYKEIVTDLSLEQIAEMTLEEVKGLPVRYVPVIDYAAANGLEEVVQIIRQGE